MSGSEPVERIEEKRESLEALAESDLRCSRYAKALLDVADNADAQG
jgi:hypothetical protein